jgi:hypothetical protein
MRAFTETKLARLTLGLAVLAFNAQLASAHVTEYTDQASFDAAASGLDNFNFQGIAPNNTAVFGDVNVGGVTFSAGSGSDWVINPTGGPNPPLYGGASFFSATTADDGPSQVVCTLSRATSLGFTFGDYVEPAIPLTVTLSGGESFTLTTPSNAGFDTGFVGFVSSTPITKVTFADQGTALDIVNFQASAASVPEPGTLALMATGLLGTALLGRRRRITVEAGRLDLRRR